MRYPTRTYKDQQVSQIQLVKLKVCEHAVNEMDTKELKLFVIDELQKKYAKLNKQIFQAKVLKEHNITSDTLQAFEEEVADYFAA